ncbi:hypothetical protein WPS_30020 [Vulcanimicrobium alpinum]|uniref:Outer membrane protein beta-barrel domain-containing protein n=1 Tax=Vulcanimicrobium alpinum TaxID=3016050 RepID=A0AAN1XYH5_UNVUL|nr:hypothetical protein [Vulcanimicrobium alpinum]BDE07726.1 hypothetical protein WPS_30020 [Vulcanimicrobium alpinum]
MRNALRGVAVLAALAAAAAAPAAADPVDATFSITINALDGHHQVNGGTSDRLNFAPLPLGELVLRSRRESVRIEGLPPVTFGYSGAGDGADSTRLSIVNATLRHGFDGGWFLGAGQTIYNQSTTYTSVQSGYIYTRGDTVIPIVGSEVQFSRVTGARFEAGRIVERGGNRVEAWLAVNPKMHGVQYTRIPSSTFCSGFGSGGPTGCGQYAPTFADPENATQVDATLSFTLRVSKHGDVIYGMRYLNYGAHYDDIPGQLADRNVGFAPAFGYRFRF